MLHCYAEGRDGGWEAICLDLDIAVQGESFASVYRALDAAIAAYLDTVQDLPEDARARLMKRKAPLTVRLSFLGRAARTLLWGARTDAQYADFTLPVAA